MRSECICGDRWPNAEEEAVAKPRNGRKYEEEVWAFESKSADLSNAEEETGEDKAPNPAHVQSFDNDIGADAWGSDQYKALGLHSDVTYHCIIYR